MGLISVVDEWMKGNYDEKKLYPCWYSVVCVVADGLGGQNPAAARNIAHRWKSELISFLLYCLRTLVHLNTRSL